MWKLNIAINKNQDLIKMIKEESLIKYVMVGNNDFAYRIPASYELEEIDLLNQYLDQQEIIVNMTKLFHNHELPMVKQYLLALKDKGINTIMIADLAIVQICRELNLQMQIIYNTETTITNQYFDYFAKQNNFYGIEVAKEINLKEIKEIVENKQTIVGCSIQGQIYMYQSMRPLLTNFFAMQKQSFEQDKQYYLFDKEREVYYPITENKQGTHILASNDVCMIHKLDDLIDIELDYVKLDAYLYKGSDFNHIVQLYIEAIKLLQANPEIYQAKKMEYFKTIKQLCPYKQFSTGFFYKTTIY